MDTLFLINLIVEAVLAIAAIVGNTIVLVALYKNNSLHTVTNCLIASLAMADLLVGVVIPLYLLPLFGLPHEFYSCVFLNCLIVVMTGTSVLHLLAIASERFIAIKFPFWYHANFTMRIAIGLGLSGWVLGIVFGLVPMMGWNNGWNDENICSFVLVINLKQHVYFTFFGTVVLPLFMMLLIYISIFVEVQRSARQIAALTVKGIDDKDAKDRSASTTAEIKAAKKFTLVIVMFVVCWFPLELQNCAIVWYGLANVLVIFVSVWLTHLNSAINPILYAYGNSVLRRTMKNVILCRDPHTTSNTGSSA